jgi:hypothetical protein
VRYPSDLYLVAKRFRGAGFGRRRTLPIPPIARLGGDGVSHPSRSHWHKNGSLDVAVENALTPLMLWRIKHIDAGPFRPPLVIRARSRSPDRPLGHACFAGRLLHVRLQATPRPQRARMNLDDRELRECGLGEDDIAFVGRMARGGSSGGSGYDYENHYAVHRLIRGAKNLLYDRQSGSLSVARQCRVPVDDVIVRTTNLDVERYDFCQLKTGATATWGADDGKLIRQFDLQRRIGQARRLSYELVIVTPHPDRLVHFRREVPGHLAADTKVELFALHTRRPDFWSVPSEVLDNLRLLCAYDGDSPSQRERIAVAFFNAWYDLPQTDGYCDLDTVLQELGRNPHIPILNPDVELSLEDAVTLERMNSIPQVFVSVVGGFCHWRCGMESGEIGKYGTPSVTSFFSRFRSTAPTDVGRFLELV